MLALTDTQLDLVTRAAALLPVHDRDRFLRSIANRLDNKDNPTDGNIRDAIDFVLGCRGRRRRLAGIRPTETSERIIADEQTKILSRRH
jgi:hypothetical protein